MARSKSKLATLVGSGRNGPMRRRVSSSIRTPEGVSKPAIRRLARRAGVKRMSEGIYTEAPLALRAWLKRIIGDAVVYADHAKRFTLTVNDVILSLKRNGATLYGYTYYEKRERLTRKLPASSLQQQTAKAKTPAKSSLEKTEPCNPAAGFGGGGDANGRC
jgi:histone H4